jgi:hypothetical protein
VRKSIVVLLLCGLVGCGDRPTNNIVTNKEMTARISTAYSVLVNGRWHSVTKEEFEAAEVGATWQRKGAQ